MKNVIALFTLLLLPAALSAPTAETTSSPSLSPSPSTLPAATPAPQPSSTPTPAPTPTQNTHLHFRAQDEDEEPKGQPPRTSQFWLDFTKPFDPLTQGPRPTDIAQPQGGGQEAVEFGQTTYFTCKTRDATITHCGWHIPITWVGEAGGERVRGGGWGVGARAGVVGVVAAVVALMV